jgi:hypothetical protein
MKNTNYKRIYIVASILSVLSVVLIYFIPTASASFKSTLHDWIETILVFDVEPIKTVLLTETQAGTQTFFSIIVGSTLIDLLITAIITATSVLVFFNLIANIIHQITATESAHVKDWELMLKILIKLCVSLMLLLNVKEMIGAFDQFISILVNNLYDLLTDSIAGVDTTEDAINALYDFNAKGAGNIKNLLGGFMLYCLPYGAAWLSNAAILFSCFSILFELVLMRVFFPVAIKSIADDGIRSAGVAYIKSYMACYSRAGAALIIAAIITLSMTALSTIYPVDEAFNMWSLGNIAIRFTGVMAINKSGEILNRAFA